MSADLTGDIQDARDRYEAGHISAPVMNAEISLAMHREAERNGSLPSGNQRPASGGNGIGQIIVGAFVDFLMIPKERRWIAAIVWAGIIYSLFHFPAFSKSDGGHVLMYASVVVALFLTGASARKLGFIAILAPLAIFVFGLLLRLFVALVPAPAHSGRPPVVTHPAAVVHKAASHPSHK